MRAAISVLLCGLAVGSAGCAGGGGGDFEGREREVAEAVRELQVAASRQDNAAEVCREHFSADLVRRLSSGGTQCATEIREAIGDSDLFELQVVDVTVRGASAQARVETVAGGETTVGNLRLVEERRGWRLDAIATESD